MKATMEEEAISLQDNNRTNQGTLLVETSSIYYVITNTSKERSLMIRNQPNRDQERIFKTNFLVRKILLDEEEI
jgi:hypothetical protein